MTKMHPTPMLDQLEGGPWPSFVTGFKRLAEKNPMMVDLLGQLEHSYENRKGYWKGGTVSVYGYGGGVIPRFLGGRGKVSRLGGVPYPAHHAATRDAL